MQSTSIDFNSSEMMTPLSVVQHFVLHPNELHELLMTMWSEINSTELYKKWKILRKRPAPQREFVTPLDNALLRKTTATENFSLEELVAKSARLPLAAHSTDPVKVSTDNVLVVYEKLMKKMEARHKNLWKLGSIVTSLCLLTEQEEVDEQELKQWTEAIVSFGKQFAEQYLKAVFERRERRTAQNVGAKPKSVSTTPSSSQKKYSIPANSTSLKMSSTGQSEDSMMMTPLCVVQFFSENPEKFKEVSRKLWQEIQKTSGCKVLRARRRIKNVSECAAIPFRRAFQQIQEPTLTVREFISWTIGGKVSIGPWETVPIEMDTMRAIFEKIETSGKLSSEFVAIVTGLCLLVEQEGISDDAIESWIDKIMVFGVKLWERYWRAKMEAENQNKGAQ